MNFNSIQKWIDSGMPFNSMTNGDCMDALLAMPDNYVDLVLADPPYGIGVGVNGIVGVNKAAPCKQYKPVKWDSAIPKKEYFEELFRVSKNQIIWGGNYFIEYLKNTSCMVVWDKDNSGNFADCELAWTSFATAVRKFKYRWNGMLQENMKQKEIRIHPVQKPVALYRWLLQNYANKGDKILDTHVGSGSSIIACIEEHFEYCGFELDADYHRDATARIEEMKAQGRMF